MYSKGRSLSGIDLTGRDTDDLRHIPPQPIGLVPADYLDPQHPHNGDIEGHIGSPNHGSGLSKRTTWILVTTIIFSVAIGAAMGVGIFYGKTHAAQKSQGPKPVVVTASASTTVAKSHQDIETHTVTTQVELPPPKPTVPFERPQPATSPAPPTPTSTNSLQVFFAHTHDEKAMGNTKKDSFFWHAFRGTVGTDIDPCKASIVNSNDDFEFYDFDPAKHSNPGILPRGAFAMEIDGKRCTLEAFGEDRSDRSVGWLHCYKWAAWTVKCFKHRRFEEEHVTECHRNGIPQYYHVAIYCEW